MGVAQTRTAYNNDDDVVSLKDSALEAAVNFQMRKPQWSAFVRSRISGSVSLSGIIDYQNKTIGDYQQFKGAGDITAVIPFGKDHTVEFGPYVSQIDRYVRFDFGEVQRSDKIVNYGWLLRGNFEALKMGDFHVDWRVMFGLGWQDELALAGGSEIKTKFTTLDVFAGVPVIYSTAKNCELENSEHSEDHRCYWFSVMPYFGSRRYMARAGNAFDQNAFDPNSTVDSERTFLGVDADVHVYGPLRWMVNFQDSQKIYLKEKKGQFHSVDEYRVMTGLRFSF
ncbi:hypothetical protein HZB03_00835 [Candidatus Woesearchaeota archaeon]|nr:hypothetical protein [Candidatus Woesearchaeota archaeon]